MGLWRPVCRETSNTTKPAPPTGGAGKRPSTESPPDGGLVNERRRRAARPGPGSMPSKPDTSAEQDQIAALRGQNKNRLKKINELESKMNQPPPPPHPPAAEEMERELMAPNAATREAAAFEARFEARFGGH
ncbi:hypothetical protein HPB47_007017 [Ixodes persulcatus]|uniref:Uncharacterized protein n=1 Tax=Ixodes persulcatus TaxID=34615 RepID=A0AC60P8W7_IXOPE|nr:hypothetical protein HPB47_007017 [Ixodes persulcatus]